MAAIAVAAGVISVAAPVAATAAGPGVPLDTGGFAHIVVDAAHGHVFVSGGNGTSTVEVTGLDGAKAGEVDGEEGASGMALSPDGGTLYVALSQGDAIAAVDTSTLKETARYATGDGTRPQGVVVAGGRVWFSYAGDGSQVFGGGLGSVDPGAGSDDGGQSTTPSVTLEPPAWYGAPVLAGDPADPDKVVAADGGLDPATLEVYDVSSGHAVQAALAKYAIDNSVRDLTVTPDGQDLVVAAAADQAVQRFRMSDLAPDGTYPLGVWPVAVAMAPDGTLAAGSETGSGADLAVFGPGERAAKRDFAVDVQAAGLAWDPDGSRLFAVAGGGDQPVLHVYDDPGRGDNALALNGPSSAVPGRAYTLSGRMTSREPFADGQTAHVTRTDAADPDGAALPDVPVAADGAFSFTDTAAGEGTVHYEVSYDGDSLHLPAQGTAAVPVAKADSGLAAHAPATAAFGKPLTVSGTLTSPEPFAAGQTVGVSVTNAQHTVSAGTVKVAANGSFALSTTPYVGGPVSYTVTYAGDIAHHASTTTATTQVSRTATALTVAAGTAPYAYGARATVTAHLGATYNSRTVSLYAQPLGGAKTLLRTGTVDAHGNLSTTYAVTRATTFSVGYAGDYRYAPATATRKVTAYARVTDSLRGNYTTTTSGSTRYAVYHHTVDPVQAAVVAPAKKGECVAFTAQEWYGHAWRTIASASCMPADATSTALAQLTGTHPVGPHFRYRAQYRPGASDPANLAAYGAWVPFLFRN